VAEDYEDARRVYRTEVILSDYSDANELMPYFPEHCEKIGRDAGSILSAGV
jgi:hypothetical protein